MTSYGLLHHSSKSSTSLRGDAYRQSSFWTVARMPCGKNGKRQHDTEWRIYYPDDVYRFPHHGHRFFSGALNDVFRSPLLVTCFPKIVILNGRKNAVREKRETATWHRVKNLWLWWRLTAFLTTGIDPSRSLRMTFNVFLTTTANPLLLFRMTPNGNHMLRLLTHS